MRREEKTINKKNSPQNGALFVVPIGASAGGIEACRNLIKTLPEKNICYIFCQHLSPHHSSVLREILSRDTQLIVVDTENDQQLEAGHFYVAIPNSDIRIENGRIYLSEPESGVHPKPSVDKLFDSVARDAGASAIAIVLSGTGSDGSKGVVTVKKHGGLVLVQDPSCCQYEGMPRTAISTGVVDLVAEPESLAAGLTRLLSQAENGADLTESDDALYDRIYQRINDITGVDFSRYKDSGTHRRILRRIAMLNVQSLEEYEKVLQDDEREVWQLTNNNFVVVSEFYRDKLVFDRMYAVMREAIAAKDNNEDYRIWVAGCATGEEAYTLAMIADQVQRDCGKNVVVKILATDLSAEAIAIARTGVYERDKLRNVPEEWLAKYFIVDGDTWRVKDYIRSTVTFSLHNLISDAPFSRLDLVSCRNLLIYFGSETQHDVLSTLAFSLCENGVLLLGGSEHCALTKYFTTVDEASKIYRRTGLRSKIGFSHLVSSPKTVSTHELAKSSKIEEGTRFYQAVIDVFAPPLLVIDQENNIVFKEGTSQLLLRESSGFISADVFENLKEMFRAETRALLFRSRQSGAIEKGGVHELEVDSETKRYSLSVAPFSLQFPQWNIIFLSEKTQPYSQRTEDGGASLIDELDRELSETRENLQVVIEELETANEQLQVFNEELQSSNEEYQSTNEELQTVNEELQSSNEELLTITEEHATQTRSYQCTTSDLVNIQESLRVPLAVLNEEYRFSRFNQAFSEMFRDQLVRVGDPIFSVDTGMSWENLKSIFEQVVKQSKSTSYEIVKGDVCFECQISPYLNGDGEVHGCIMMFYDTTQYKDVEKRLLKEKQLAQTTLETVREGVIRLSSDLSIEYANSIACQITGWTLKQMIGKSIARVVRLVDDDDEYELEKKLQIALDGGTVINSQDGSLLLKARRGDDVYIEYSFASMVSNGEAGDAGGVFAFADVTDRREQFSTLLWNSTHDALTGLVNRDEVERRIDSAIMTAKRNNSFSSVLYLDLDQFKVVNDTCGHAAGDKLLKQLSMLMADMLRSRDTLARLGGDEFVVLLDKCPIVEAEQIAKKLQSAINKYRFLWEEKIFHVGVSIGVVEIGSQYNDVSELLINADTACYHAKESGRNLIEVHSAENAGLDEKRSLLDVVSHINEALEKDRFRLYFQEICPQGNNSTRYWEVLVRMFNGPGDFLLPGAFLPSAERFGLVKQIDLWVLENSIKMLSDMCQSTGCDFPSVSINVSGATVMSREYIKTLKRLLTDYSVDPSKLCLELTETVAVSNLTRAKAFIDQLREIGCCFALDDFGMGMSSLAYLKELPMDYLKIDASFVKDIAEDEVNAAIVSSVKQVSDVLGLKTIAEGVESEDQAEHLREVGIDYLQGFLLRRPVPFEEFSSLVVDRNPVV